MTDLHERPLPPRLIADLLVAADLLSARWKARNAEVGRRLAGYADELSRAVLADRAAQPVRMLTAAECHAVRDEAFPNEPAPLVGFAQAVIRKFCEVNGIVPLAPQDTGERA